MLATRSPKQWAPEAAARSNMDAAAALGLPTLDATCPLVSKVHSQGEQYVQQGRLIAVTAVARHLERVWAMVAYHAAHLVQSEDGGLKLGLAPRAPIAYVSQTPLSVDETKSIIAALHGVAKDLSCKLPAEINH